MKQQNDTSKITKTLMPFLVLCQSCIIIPPVYAQAAADTDTPILPTPKTPTAVFALSECPLTPKAAGDGREAFGALAAGLLIPLAEAIIKPVAEAGVNFIAKKLEKRALALSASSTSNAHGVFYKFIPGNENQGAFPSIGVNLGCVVIIRADFGAQSALFSVESTSKKAQSDSNAIVVSDSSGWSVDDLTRVNTVLTELKSVSTYPKRFVQLRSVPEVYLEFKVDTIWTQAQRLSKNADDETVIDENSKPEEIATSFGLQPTVFRYRVPGPERSRNEKSVMVNLNISAGVVENNAIENKLVYSHAYNLGKFKAGDTREVLSHVVAPLQQVPLPSRLEQSSLVSDASGNLDIVKTSSINFVPLTIQATVSELESGGDLERAIANSLRENRDNIVTPVLTLTREQLERALGVEEDDNDNNGR